MRIPFLFVVPLGSVAERDASSAISAVFIPGLQHVSRIRGWKLRDFIRIALPPPCISDTTDATDEGSIPTIAPSWCSGHWEKNTDLGTLKHKAHGGSQVTRSKSMYSLLISAWCITEYSASDAASHAVRAAGSNSGLPCGGEGGVKRVLGSL